MPAAGGRAHARDMKPAALDTASQHRVATAEPVFDRKRLRELTEGDAEFERQLIDAYKESASSILAQLRANFAAGNTEGIARDAHGLRGASLNVGASSMARCAADIEAAARAGDAVPANERLEQLAMEEQALWLELGKL